MKSGVRKNFTEIRKLIGYKNEESIAEVLGLTRQTLSKFGTCYDNAYEDNTHNTLLLSVLALMDNFIYENRFDVDNIDNYIEALDKYFFSEIWMDDELQNENRLYFLIENNVRNRYVKLWLDTFNYEKLIPKKDDVEIDYREPTIRQIISNYHIYILSDFLLEDNADKFLVKLFDILAKKEKNVKISNHTIDVIQDSRLSYEGNIYKNSVQALNIIKGFKDNGMLQIMKSNPWSKNEVELVKSEIYKLDKKNAIVFTQNTDEILQINHYGGKSLSNIMNLDFKVLCLKLNKNEEINFDERIGYEIRHSIDY